MKLFSTFYLLFTSHQAFSQPVRPLFTFWGWRGGVLGEAAKKGDSVWQKWVTTLGWLLQIPAPLQSLRL